MTRDVAAELSLDRLMSLLDSPCETGTLDFKETADLTHCRDRVELAKDVLAMANSGGGYIVIGVEDASRRQVGISEGVSAALRDAKTVNDQLKKYCGRYIKVLVAQHEIQHPAEGSIRLALIRVPAATMEKVPAQDNGVYPDPTDPAKQKWVFRRGDIYVRKGDESVKVETPEDLRLGQPSGSSELQIEAARDAVRAYGQRLERSLSAALPPLLPSEAPEEVCGESLIHALLAPRDFLLLGPSGRGKSFHLKHLCLAALNQNELPVLVRAGRYRGEDDLADLVDYRVALFSPENDKTLLRASSLCGFRPLLVIDGLNECQPRLEELLGEIQAFQLRHSCRIIMASQTDLLCASGQGYR